MVLISPSYLPYIPLACTTALGLFLFTCGMWVSHQRNQTLDGTKGNIKKLERAIRSHNNTSQYIQYYAAVFLYYAIQSHLLSLYNTTLMIMATVSRICIGIGLLQEYRGVHPLRFWGAWGTYIVGVLLSVNVTTSYLFSNKIQKML